jgi:hypothetical protein
LHRSHQRIAGADRVPERHGLVDALLGRPRLGERTAAFVAEGDDHQFDTRTRQEIGDVFCHQRLDIGRRQFGGAHGAVLLERRDILDRHLHHMGNVDAAVETDLVAGEIGNQ